MMDRFSRPLSDLVRRPPRMSFAAIVSRISIMVLACCIVVTTAAMADLLPWGIIPADHDLVTLAEKCFQAADGNDAKETVHVCKALEQKAHEGMQEASRLGNAKSNGRILSEAEFGTLNAHIYAESLATRYITEAYHSLGILGYGREYAVQAIGWSLYDAKDVHDLIATLRQLASEHKLPPDRGFRQALKLRLDDDKLTAKGFENFYPGVTQESAARVHMTATEYHKLIDGM